ncbi:NAD(P)-binding protein [Neobacillus sp. FSL H8-0543]|uniref:NAD(P)-binding protein n=1 Tax=Neobacillus sp. FSL H8-0543 TaxID=2954672 RepID=UPI003158EA7E
MSSYYPIMLRLEGKRVVVVGGGKVSERKVSGMLGTGADIVVISPEATAELQRLASSGEIDWKRKSFSAEDLGNAFMIFAATNDYDLNQSIRRITRNHQLVTIVDDPEGSDFHVPSQMQRGRLSIAVSTGGASPKLASKIREELAEQFDDSYEDYLDFLFQARQQVLKEVKDSTIKKRLLSAIVSSEFLTSKDREGDFNRLYEEMKAGT